MAMEMEMWGCFENRYKEDFKAVGRLVSTIHGCLENEMQLCWDVKLFPREVEAMVSNPQGAASSITLWSCDHLNNYPKVGEFCLGPS